MNNLGSLALIHFYYAEFKESVSISSFFRCITRSTSPSRDSNWNKHRGRTTSAAIWQLRVHEVPWGAWSKVCTSQNPNKIFLLDTELSKIRFYIEIFLTKSHCDFHYKYQEMCLPSRKSSSPTNRVYNSIITIVIGLRFLKYSWPISLWLSL